MNAAVIVLALLALTWLFGWPAAAIAAVAVGATFVGTAQAAVRGARGLAALRIPPDDPA